MIVHHPTERHVAPGVLRTVDQFRVRERGKHNVESHRLGSALLQQRLGGGGEFPRSHGRSPMACRARVSTSTYATFTGAGMSPRN